MAKLTALILLLAFIAISTLTTTVYNPFLCFQNRYGPGSLNINQCKPECDRRCGQTQYKNACLLFCNKCCRKCLCVPPGYYGNKGVCPCYNNWKTKEGGPKCP
ncbi:hypothetical protein DH2020_048316 [Rehmannia glutinosa]|uniref:Uncharacterized protein n=1 Tax=Rehmannia glutinosa TaxID=99300 RepID=A0ABR0U615_REHGL